MEIARLINKLQEFQKKNGDAEVFVSAIHYDRDSTYHEIEEIEGWDESGRIVIISQGIMVSG